MRCGSLSLASVYGAPSQVAYLKGCRDPSHYVLVDQSEASLRNSPPYAQYERNMPCLQKLKNILQSAAWRAKDVAPRLSLLLPQMYSRPKGASNRHASTTDLCTSQLYSSPSDLSYLLWQVIIFYIKISRIKCTKNGTPS